VRVGRPTLHRRRDLSREHGPRPTLAPSHHARCDPHPTPEPAILHSAVFYFVIPHTAAPSGFGGIAPGAPGIAKLLFVLFAVLAIASFLFGLIRK